jgi:hypothetical protein
MRLAMLCPRALGVTLGSKWGCVRVCWPLRWLCWTGPSTKEAVVTSGADHRRWGLVQCRGCVACSPHMKAHMRVCYASIHSCV